MASVQYSQRNLWKVSIYLQISWFNLIDLKLFKTFTVHFFFNVITLSSAAAGSAVSVKPASDSVTPASVSGMGTLTDSSSGPASLLTTSNQTSLSALGHSEEMPPSTIPPPQHNKWVAAKFTHLIMFMIWVCSDYDIRYDVVIGCSQPSCHFYSSHPSQQNSLAPSSVRTSNSGLLVSF